MLRLVILTRRATPALPGTAHRIIQTITVKWTEDIPLTGLGNRVSLWVHWFLVAGLLLNALHLKTYLIITALASQDLDLTTA